MPRGKSHRQFRREEERRIVEIPIHKIAEYGIHQHKAQLVRDACKNPRYKRPWTPVCQKGGYGRKHERKRRTPKPFELKRIAHFQKHREHAQSGGNDTRVAVRSKIVSNGPQNKRKRKGPRKHDHKRLSWERAQALCWSGSVVFAFWGNGGNITSKGITRHGQRERRKYRNQA